MRWIFQFNTHLSAHLSQWQWRKLAVALEGLLYFLCLQHQVKPSQREGYDAEDPLGMHIAQICAMS